MSIQKIPVAGYCFSAAQTSTALVPVTGAGTPAPSGGLLTYTTTGAHGLTAGMSVTFNGTTRPVTYAANTFVVLSVPSTTTFVIASNLAAITVAGSVIPIFIPRAGMHMITTGANALVQYDAAQYAGGGGFVEPGDILVGTNLTTPPTATVQAPTPQSPNAATWNQLIPVSSGGTFWTDGFAVQVLCSGSAGTTVWSKVA